jgi:hypothetical protein
MEGKTGPALDDMSPEELIEAALAKYRERGELTSGVVANWLLLVDSRGVMESGRETSGLAMLLSYKTMPWVLVFGLLALATEQTKQDYHTAPNAEEEEE